MNLLDLLMYASLQIDTSDILGNELKDCTLKAQSLLMSVLHKDSLTGEWTQELQRHMDLYKDTYAERKKGRI